MATFLFYRMDWDLATNDPLLYDAGNVVDGAGMRRINVHWIAVSLVLALAIAACDSTGPDEGTVWGSNAAGLTISQSRATLLIDAGGCYGSFGQINQPIPSGAFALSGTFTQLMGAYPGKVQFDAQFVGTVEGTHMMVSINVPSLQKIVGPFNLTEGVATKLSACLYP
jgi:hypothetical protein